MLKELRSQLHPDEIALFFRRRSIIADRIWGRENGIEASVIGCSAGGIGVEGNSIYEYESCLYAIE
jgi:hypothetical protein